jgi:hypothetical protein
MHPRSVGVDSGYKHDHGPPQDICVEGDHARVGGSLRPSDTARSREGMEGRARQHIAARARRPLCHMDRCPQLGDCHRRGRGSSAARDHTYSRKNVGGHDARGAAGAGACILGSTELREAGIVSVRQPMSCSSSDTAVAQPRPIGSISCRCPIPSTSRNRALSPILAARVW